jgi:hypothetical protein
MPNSKRRAVFVPHGIDILALAADAEKCDGPDRAEFFVTRLQVWQLMTGRFGHGSAHFVFGDQPYALAQAPPISIARSVALSRSVLRKGVTACS